MLETCPWFRCSSIQQFLTGVGITSDADARQFLHKRPILSYADARQKLTPLIQNNTKAIQVTSREYKRAVEKSSGTDLTPRPLRPSFQALRHSRYAALPDDVHRGVFMCVSWCIL